MTLQFCICAALTIIHVPCSCGSRNLGGFVPEDVSSPEYQTYAALALSEYIKNSAESQLKECQPNYGAAKQSISVVAACKQVVAGTNYSILFNVKFPCRNETFNAERAVVQKLAAVIYVPLPSSNTEPRVISVKQV